MNASHPSSYSGQEWHNRELFVRIITRICRELGITLTWFSDNWIARLQKGTHTHYIVGYVFPLNSTTAGTIMRDKAATYTLLADAGVPAIAHSLLALPRMHDTAAAITYAKTMSLPLVLKPNSGEAGFDVMRCTTPQELEAAISTLSTRHRLLAISPYTHISREFRVVMLHSQPLLTFEKRRADSEWRHNLKHGAEPALITDPKLCAQLQVLARRALSALGGHLAAIDIAQTPNGLMVVEINGGIALNQFAAHSPAYAVHTYKVYTAILKQ